MVSVLLLRSMSLALYLRLSLFHSSRGQIEETCSCQEMFVILNLKQMNDAFSNP